MFNTWYTNPEAFQSDYEEYQALMRKLAQEHEQELAAEGRKEMQFDDDEQPEGDLFDIVREHDEREDNLSDAEADADTLASAGMGTDEDYGDWGDPDIYEPYGE